MDKQRTRGYEGVKPAPGKDDPELDPYEIEFRPEFRSGRGPREPFVNEHGVVIGDHDYESPDSPLEQWSEDTDPSVMAGEQWVHPYKDIGFRTRENRDLFERGISPQAGVFMHPTHDSAAGDEPEIPHTNTLHKGEKLLDTDLADSEEEYVLDEP